MRVLRFQISMFLTGRLAPCFGLEKIFQMMAWRVMTHAVADSFWGINASARLAVSKLYNSNRRLTRSVKKVPLHPTLFSSIFIGVCI